MTSSMMTKKANPLFSCPPPILILPWFTGSCSFIVSKWDIAKETDGIALLAVVEIDQQMMKNYCANCIMTSSLSPKKHWFCSRGGMEAMHFFSLALFTFNQPINVLLNVTTNQPHKSVNKLLGKTWDSVWSKKRQIEILSLLLLSIKVANSGIFKG